jgi:hypothetical protein
MRVRRSTDLAVGQTHLNGFSRQIFIARDFSRQAGYPILKLPALPVSARVVYFLITGLIFLPGSESKLWKNLPLPGLWRQIGGKAQRISSHSPLNLDASALDLAALHVRC